MIVIIDDKVIYRVQSNLSNLIEKCSGYTFESLVSKKIQYIEFTKENHKNRVETGCIQIKATVTNNKTAENKKHLGCIYREHNSTTYIMYKLLCPILIGSICIKKIDIANNRESESISGYSEGFYYHSFNYNYIDIEYQILCDINNYVFVINSEDRIDKVPIREINWYSKSSRKKTLNIILGKKYAFNYSEALTFSSIHSYTKDIDRLLNLGFDYSEINYSKIGYYMAYGYNKKTRGFINYDTFLYELSKTKVIFNEETNEWTLGLSKDFIQHITPFYKLLIEEILNISIENINQVIVPETSVYEKNKAVAYLLYIISINADFLRNMYTAFLLIGEIPPSRFASLVPLVKDYDNAKINIIRDLLSMKVTDTKKVLYRVGDHDDEVTYTYEIYITFSDLNETESLPILNRIFPELQRKESSNDYYYEYKNNRFEKDWCRPNYDYDNSEDSRRELLIKYITEVTNFQTQDASA